MLSMEGRERGEAVRMGTRERKPRKIQNQTQPLLFEFVVHFQWSDNCNSSAWATWLSHLTLPFLRSLDVFHSLHLENGVQEKKQNTKPPFLCTHMHTPQWSIYVYAYIRCIYQIIYHRCSHIYSSSSTEVFFSFCLAQLTVQVPILSRYSRSSLLEFYSFSPPKLSCYTEVPEISFC